MLNIASSSVSNVYAIPTANWTAINKRVGAVLSTVNVEGFMTQLLPQYPALMSASQFWQQSTFNSLITQSQALYNYANTAIGNFNTLNRNVQAVQQQGSSIPGELQQETIQVLQALKTATDPLAASFNSLFTAVQTFLTANEVVDAEIALVKQRFGSFWGPLGDTIQTVEQSIGLVTGNWQAITDDLKNAIVSPVSVDLPFIESLNIQAAIVSWQSVQAEAGAFAGNVAGQQQYWTNPNQ